MPLEDKEARLRVMREIAKFDVDSSMLDVKLINGVLYMRAHYVSVARAPENLRTARDMEEVVRGVINDVVMGSQDRIKIHHDRA